MTCNNIFSHERLEFCRWLEGLLAVPNLLLTGRKRGKEVLLEINYLDHFIKCLMDKI
jgi:hypothetical protein